MNREEAITILKDISWQMGSVKRWENIEAIDMAIEALQELPKRRKEVKRWKAKALQSEPVKHGEWITNKLGLFECTACNTMLFTKQKDWSFCPYCGAKMKGQEE